MHHLHLSVESVRQLMIADGLPALRSPGWRARWAKTAVIHQMRERRPRLGELVQMGMVRRMSTDATCRVSPRLSGKPLAFYSDKHSIFRVNDPTALSGNGLTHFGRAITELGPALIPATLS